jgi:hypothetical protein
MTTRRLARTVLSGVLAAAAFTAAGCGTKQAVVTQADTEGVWVDSGPLDYHVQGSRLLNPGQPPDRSYLSGLASGTTQPTGKEVWFAVFMRIENKTDHPATPSQGFQIEDTEGHRFTPVALDPNVNPFAYEPIRLDPNRVIPVQDSPQDFNSFSGAEILFKLPLDSYQNRPLELIIKSGGGPGPSEARVSLDV